METNLLLDMVYIVGISKRHVMSSVFINFIILFFKVRY